MWEQFMTSSSVIVAQKIRMNIWWKRFGGETREHAPRAMTSHKENNEANEHIVRSSIKLVQSRPDREKEMIYDARASSH